MSGGPGRRFSADDVSKPDGANEFVADGLAISARGRTARTAMELLEQEAEARDRKLCADVFRLIDNHELTPDIAVQTWMERYALDRLRGRLGQVVAIGERASTAVLSEAEEKEPIDSDR